VVRREDLAHAAADAALAVPGVARLSPGNGVLGPGTGVEVSTQFAGGKVLGVRLGGERAEVHIVADRVPLPPITDQVAAAVGAVLAAAGEPKPVTVVVDDLEAAAIDRRARG
jgi:hypothetical protein